jgi:hypothetical protein
MQPCQVLKVIGCNLLSLCCMRLISSARQIFYIYIVYMMYPISERNLTSYTFRPQRNIISLQMPLITQAFLTEYVRNEII